MQPSRPSFVSGLIPRSRLNDLIGRFCEGRLGRCCESRVGRFCEGRASVGHAGQAGLTLPVDLEGLEETCPYNFALGGLPCHTCNTFGRVKMVSLRSKSGGAERWTIWKV